MSITTAKIQAVTRGITQSFDDGLRKPVSNLHGDICTVVPSSSRDENYGWVGDVPKMKEFLGERQFDQLRAFNYSIANKTFEQSLGVDRHDIDDDRYAHYATMAAALAEEANRHPDELLASLIVSAASSLCYDGQYFYDSDHLAGDSGTQSNISNATAATGTTPTVAEFRTAFTNAIIAMLKIKSDKGNYFMPRAITKDLLKNFHILVPLAMWETAEQAMSQFFIAQGGVAVDTVLLARAQVHPVLGMGAEGSGSDAKFQVLYTGGMMKPFIFQKRSGLKRQVKGRDDIEEKLVKFMTEVRYNMGYGLWQYAHEVTFT